MTKDHKRADKELRAEYDGRLMRHLTRRTYSGDFPFVVSTGSLKWILTWEYPGFLSASLDICRSISVSCTPEPVTLDHDEVAWGLSWEPYLDIESGAQVPNSEWESATEDEDFRVPFQGDLFADANAIRIAIQHLLTKTYGWFFSAIHEGDGRCAIRLAEVVGDEMEYENPDLLKALTEAQVRFWQQYVTQPEGGDPDGHRASC